MTTIRYLEMLSSNELQPASKPANLDVQMVDPPDSAVNERMYREVGAGWNWTDRLVWNRPQWEAYANLPSLETWVGRVEQQEVGYFELSREEEGNVQIAYFGLLPAFIGQGLGGALLTAAIRRAWDIPATRRVWLHTCTEDHQHALNNYERRGFKVFKVEQA